MSNNWYIHWICGRIFLNYFTCRCIKCSACKMVLLGILSNITKAVKKPGGLHEGELQWTGLKFGPAKSAHIDSEIQTLRVEARSFWYVLVQLQYPSKRRRCHHPLSLSLTSSRLWTFDGLALDFTDDPRKRMKNPYPNLIKRNPLVVNRPTAHFLKAGYNAHTL